MVLDDDKNLRQNEWKMLAITAERQKILTKATTNDDLGSEEIRSCNSAAPRKQREGSGVVAVPDGNLRKL